MYPARSLLVYAATIGAEAEEVSSAAFLAQVGGSRLDFLIPT
jgi:hypothetical protein